MYSWAVGCRTHGLRSPWPAVGKRVIMTQAISDFLLNCARLQLTKHVVRQIPTGVSMEFPDITRLVKQPQEKKMKIPGTRLKYSHKILSKSCFIRSSLLLILLKLQSFKVGDSQKSPPHIHLPSHTLLNIFNIHPYFSVSQQGGEMYGMKKLLLVLMLVVACDTVCPKNCACVRFGSSWVTVKCTNINQVPRDIPSNTILL